MKLAPQEPAEGILKQGEWDDARSYTVPCTCCGTDCEHNVWVESDVSGVTVTTYTKQKTNWWSRTRWYHIWTLLTRGYVEYEASIIMTRQQAFNYADALNRAVTDVDEFRKKRKQNV